MSHFQQHREFFNRPIMLTAEEQTNPLLVFDDFFTDYNLIEVREMNQDTDRLCLSTDDPPFNEATTRDGLISYRRSEERLVEAAYILWKKGISPNTPLYDQTEMDANPTPTTDADNFVKGLSEIQAALSDVWKILEAQGDVYSSTTTTDASESRDKDKDHLKAKQPFQTTDFQKKILDLQIRIAKLMLQALQLWPKIQT